MSGFEISDLHKSFGAQQVLRGLQLAAEAGSFTAVLGTSGSGKTTLLRLLAGFDRPDRGTIAIGGRVVDDKSRHISPERRRIGYVPQEGTLFPHLTAEANIGFGLDRGRRRARVAELLDLVGLESLGRRYPHQLSGGQQQRVALARALAIEPEVVLLDEPFASLDTNLRASVREEVRAILSASGTTAVLVTHDQDEALSLADLVAVLRQGAIAQYAPPHALYSTPADSDLARFLGGANLLDGTLTGGIVDTPLGRFPALQQGDRPAAPSPVIALVRPEQITVRPAESGGELTGHVTRAGYHGHDTVVHIETDAPHDGRQLVARTSSGAELPPGTRVALAIEGPVYVWLRREQGVTDPT